MKQKSDLHPGLVWGALAILIILIGGWFFMGTRGATEMVDKSKVDMVDGPSVLPGQPGYRERTTDPPVGESSAGQQPDGRP